MSKVIDERVVEMQFDNKDFEKNVSESIKSLDKLKDSLKFENTAKSIDEINNSLKRLNFDGINKAVDALTKKFSVIGTVIDQVIRKATDKGLNAVGSIFDKIASGGLRRATNMENATFTMQGLLGKENVEQLDEVMKAVNNAVTGTRYSLDEAAVVASQLVAAGKTNGEELEKVLTGIAGAASIVNRNFGDIGDILTDVAAKGELSGDELNRFTERGINLSAELGKVLGKTSAEVRKMVTDHQISFDMLAETLNIAFGEHSKAANETYAGSLANLNSAFARIGETVQSEKMKTMTKIFNGLRPLVNEANKALAPLKDNLVKVIRLFGYWSKSILENPLMTEVVVKAATAFSNVLHSLALILIRVGEGFKQAFPEATLSNLNKVMDKIVNVSKKLMITEQFGRNLTAIFKGLFSIVKSVFIIIGSIFKIIKPFLPILNVIVGIIATALAAVADFVSGLVDALEQSGWLIKIAQGVLMAIAAVIGIVLIAIQKAVQAVQYVVSNISTIIPKIAKFVNDLFSDITSAFKKGNGPIEGFVNALKAAYEKIKGLFTKNEYIMAFFHMIEDGAHKVGSVFKWLADAISPFISELLTGKGVVIGFAIAMLFLLKSMSKTIGKVTGIIGNANGLISDMRGLIKNTVKEMVINNFLKMALGISAIAGSLALLAIALKDTDVAKFFALAFGIAAITAAMGYFARSKTDPKSMLGLIVGLAGVITAIAATLKLLDAVNNMSEAVTKLLSVGAIFGVLVVLAIILSKLGKALKGSRGIASTVLMFTGSLLLISLSLERLQNVKTEGLLDKVLALFAIMTVVMGITVLLAKTSFNDKAIIRPLLMLIATLVATSFTMNAVIRAMEKINFEALGKVLEKLKGFEWTMASLAGVIASIGFLVHTLTPLVVAIGGSFLGIGAGLWLISKAIKGIAELSKSMDITTAVAVIGGFAILIGLISGFITMGVVKSIPKDAKGFDKVIKSLSSVMISLVAATALLTLLITVMSINKDWSSYIVPFLGITALLVAIGYAVKDIKIDATGVKALKEITKMIFIFSALVIAMSLLTKTEVGKNGDYSALLGAAGTIAGLIVFMGSVTKLLETIGSMDKDFDPKKALPVIDSLGRLFIAMGVVIATTGLLSSYGDMGNQVTNGLLVISGMIVVAIAMNTLIETLESDKLGKIDESVIETLKSIGKVMMQAGIILGLVSVLGVHWGSVLAAAGGMILAIAAITGCVILLAKIEDAEIDESISDTIEAFANALLEIGIAIGIMSAVKWERALLSSVLLGFFLGGLYFCISKLAGMNDTKIDESIIKTMETFGIILFEIGALVGILSLLNPASLAVSAVSLGAVFAAFGAAIILLAKFGNNAEIKPTVIQSIKWLMLALAEIAASVGILGVLAQNGADIYAAGLMLSLVLATISGAVILLSKMGNQAAIDKSVITTIISFGAIVSVLALTMSVLTSVGKMEEIYAAGLMLSLVLVAIGGCLAIVSLFKSEEIDPSVIKSIIVLGAVGSAILLAMTPVVNAKSFKSIEKAAVGLIGVIAAISICVAALSNFTKDNDPIDKSVIITIGILGAVGSAVILAMTPIVSASTSWDKMLAAAGGLSLILAVITKCVTALADIGNKTISTSVIVTIGVLGTCTVVISEFLPKLASRKPERSLAAALSLSGILGAITLCVIKLSNIGSQNTQGAIVGALAVAAITLALTPFAGSMAELSKYDWESIAASALGMAAVLGVLTVLIDSLSAIASNPAGTAGVGVAAVAIVAIIWALSELAKSFASTAAVMDQFQEFCRLVSEFPSKGEQFNNELSSLATNSSTYITQIDQNFGNLYNGIKTSVENSISEIQKLNTELQNAGLDAADYFAGGYTNSIGDFKWPEAAYDNARVISESAVNGLMDGQDSHSDSVYAVTAGDEYLAQAYSKSIETPTNLKGAYDAGHSLSENSINGVNSVKQEATKAGEDVAKSAADGANSPQAKKEMYDRGNDLGSNLIEGISGAIDGIGDWFGGIFKDVGDFFADGWDGFKRDVFDQGAKAIGFEGGVNQIKNDYKALKDQAGDAGKVVSDMANNALKIFEDSETGKNIKKGVDNLTNSFKGLGGSAGGAGKSIKGAGEDAEDALKSFEKLADSIKGKVKSTLSFYSEFKRVSNEKEPLTGEKLLANMRSNVEGVAEWANNLNKLAGRGINKFLLQELTELGPQGFEKVSAFLNMSDEQIMEANELYGKKMAMPDNVSKYITDSYQMAGMWAGEGLITAIGSYNPVAYEETVKLGQSLVDGIESKESLDIHSPSRKFMDVGYNVGLGLAIGIDKSMSFAVSESKKLGNAVLKALKKAVGSTSLSGDASNTMGSFNKAIQKSSNPIVKSAYAVCKNLIQAMHNGLPSETFTEMGTNIINDIQNGFVEAMKKFIETMDTKLKELQKSMEEGFVKVGNDAADGLKKGIEDKIDEIAKATVEMSEKVIAKAKETLKSNSPSKVFIDMGEGIPEGLKIGIIKNAEKATGTVERVATNVVSKFQNAISEVTKSAEFGQDGMVIKPTIDLTDVESGLTRVHSMVDNGGFSIGASINNVRITGGIVDELRASKYNAKKQEPQTVNNYTTFNQTNTSPKALTNSEIYRQTNNLMSSFKNLKM